MYQEMNLLFARHETCYLGTLFPIRRRIEVPAVDINEKKTKWKSNINNKRGISFIMRRLQNIF